MKVKAGANAKKVYGFFDNLAAKVGKSKIKMR
jgi:hypothetical protein